MAAKIEKRPKHIRGCAEKGCDWQQVTSWYIGGPDTWYDMPSATLEREYVAHLHSHMPGNNRRIIV